MALTSTAMNTAATNRRAANVTYEPDRRLESSGHR
jgi:hypothetical protein